MNIARSIAMVALLAIGLAGCASLPAAAAAAAAPTDPVVARVAKAIQANGEAAYLRGANDANADWRHLLARVTAGDAVALGLAGRLRPVADAGTAEALDTAAAKALPVAPARVLELAKVGFSVEQLCTSPFIEPKPGVEKRYNDAALKALDALPPAVRPQPTFDECHHALEAIKKQL